MAAKGARWDTLPENMKARVKGSDSATAPLPSRTDPKKQPAKAENKLPRLAETDLQFQVIQWFAYTYPDLYKRGCLIAIPNAGKRGRKAAAQMKREGLWKGASDLVLFVPVGKFHGAVLEMKADGGVVSQDQKDWLQWRTEDGYHAGLAWDYDEGTKFFEEYLKHYKPHST